MKHVTAPPLEKTPFIILGAGRPHHGTLHSALFNTPCNYRIIDWLLKSISGINPDVFFVGGYQFEEIVKKYLHINYFFNPEWDQTGAAFSLLKIPFDDTKEHYVSYSDILVRDSAITEIAKVEGDIVIAIDSFWRQRYYGRSQEDLIRCEKANVKDTSVIRLGSDIELDIAEAEFVGLVRFSPKVIQFINKNIQKLNSQLRTGNLSQLIEILRVEGYLVKAVDLYGEWAELNTPNDLARFIMGSKAQTLQRLQGMVKKSCIEDQVNFTSKDWITNHTSILSTIQQAFGDQQLVVRSSSAKEDNFTATNAGVYKSLLNIDSGNISELATAIEEVIDSYSDDDDTNQVLIQPMVLDIYASGVILTRTIVHNAPYYTINYDDVTQSTESITSGSSRQHKTMVILRDNDLTAELLPAFMLDLLHAVQEIEQLLQYDSLDIEFAITTDGQIHIFQVRPIVYKVNKNQTQSTNQEIYDTVKEACGLFRELQTPSPFVVGKKAFFGIMPDWNPAEIIGTKPKKLAVSLYRFLLMDDIWAVQRAEYGYRNTRPCPLLITFAGHPYIDIRASFNSFVPACLNDALAERLVDFYMNWLEQKPHLHDKVEFEVVPTCYAFDFSMWEQRLSAENKFSAEEIAELKTALQKITTDSFDRNKQMNESLSILENRYKQVMSTALPPLEKAMLLLEDCRSYGTLVFAHMARNAFIGIGLVRSAVSEKIITQQAMDSFLNSMHTITHKFTEAASAVSGGEMPWETFLADYGHLRQGTYDIESESYAENPAYFLRPLVDREATKEISTVQPVHWENERDNFASALIEAGLSSDIDKIESFIREGIEGREYAKFIFTRNLSAALNCIIEFGSKYDISRAELANIPIDTFLSLRTGSLFASDITNLLRLQAQEGLLLHNLANKIELPPLLFKEADFSAFLYSENQPNFIGTGRVTAPCVVLENIEKKTHRSLTGCIVLIPQADPGYDWLFGQEIAGLITMWGGANSHMAIRSAEFGLPSAIGIGELEFLRYSTASLLELDAGNHRIQIIR